MNFNKNYLRVYYDSRSAMFSIITVFHIFKRRYHNIQQSVVEGYDSIINELLEIKFLEHNILIYDDIHIFDRAYSKYCKHELTLSNRIVLLLIFNEDEETVLQNLSDEGVDVERRISDGSLLIEDSVLEFFGSGTDMLEYLLILQDHAKEIGKSGLTIILDIAGLYLLGSEGDLLRFESSIGKLSHKYLAEASLLCCYHIALSGKISKDSRDRIMTGHQKIFYLLDKENGVKRKIS